MITKKVNRYYCEFCKKSNCSASSISNHEKHCTMNPNRECGMCAFTESIQLPMTKLIGPLQNIKPKIRDVEYDSTHYGQVEEWPFDKIDAALKKIMELTTCPICIMAAFRQSGIPLHIVKYNFKDECEKLLDMSNKETNPSSIYDIML